MTSAEQAQVLLTCRTCAVEVELPVEAVAGFFVVHATCRTSIDLRGGHLPVPGSRLRVVAPAAAASLRSVPEADPEARAVHTAALAALTSGRIVEARRLVADGLTRAIDPVAAAELLRLQARLSLWSGPVQPEAVVELVRSAEDVAGLAPELAAWMLCDAALVAAYGRQLPTAEQLAERALAVTRGEGLVGALASTGLGVTYGLTGRTEQAQPLLARATELLDADTGIVEAAELLQHVVLALVVQERYGDAMSAATGFLTAARSLGAVGLLPLPLCLLAHAGWKAGRWEEARLAAAEALSLAAGTQEPALELYAEAMLALVAGGQGREDVCRSRAARVMALSDRTGIGMFRVTAQMALVHLALSLQRPEEALEPLAEVERLMAGQRRVGMLNWHADHVAVLLELGRVEDAERVTRRLEQEADGNRWESAALLRCRGRLEPDHRRAVEQLRASVDAFSWQPYEQARSRLRLAQRLAVIAPEQAEPEARAALDAFTRLRARGWAAQAELLLGTPGSAVTAPAGQLSAVPAGREIRLLGGFAVLRDGQAVSISAGTSAQAVKHVALHGGRTSADELAEALWPGAEPGRGRARLRNVLTRLRRECDLLVRVGDEIALVPGVQVDVDRFLQESSRALSGDRDREVAARRAVDLYTGELLPADRYLDWTSGPRERLRTRYLQLLDQLAGACAGRGEVDEALQWWERAVDVEPYDEDRYLAMAHLLLEHGRLAPANRVVRRALSVLDKLGLPASSGLSELASRLGA